MSYNKVYLFVRRPEYSTNTCLNKMNIKIY